jgi:UDP-glucose 4-epimerase
VSHVVAYNAFGPHQKIHGVQKIVPSFATRAWRNEPLPIWGDGDQLMDLVYVDDVARMLVDATRFHNGEVFAAGTGQGVSVNDFAQKILEMTGSTGGVKHLPMRLGEPPHVQIVADKAGWDLLDWHPEFRDKDMAQTVAWYKGR